MKLNLGSGSNYLEGYVNVDPQYGKKAEVKKDACAYLVGLNENTVDEILCEHLLEHLTPDKAEGMIGHCYRVLKPGGVIFAECPDLDSIAHAYTREQYLDITDAPISFNDFLKGIFGAPGGVSVGQGHVWGYSRKTLNALLKRAGFETIYIPDRKEYRWDPDLSVRIKGIKCST